METGKPLNVIISGKHYLGVGCSKLLIENPQINILGVTGHTGDSLQDNSQKSLIKLASDNGIPILTPKAMSLSGIEELCQGRKLDLLFSFQYEKINKSSVLATAG